MDPNLFAVDWAQLGEGLTIVIILAFFVERALALFVENPAVQRMLQGTELIKELLALGLAFGICKSNDFDLLAIIFHRPEVGYFGLFITAAAIAGGSKASIKLFHDILNIKPAAPTQPAKRPAPEPAI
jgi:hypothetical protein